MCKHKKRVLDVGWIGQANPFLYNDEVIGLDIKNQACPPNYTRCETGDVQALPEPFEPDSFDAIIAGELLEHLDHPMEFLRRCLKTLKPGGSLILSTPNPNSPFEQLLTINLSRRFFYTQSHICLYPQRWLIRMLEKAGFINVKLYSGGIVLPKLGTLPWPRPWCHQTLATAQKLT